MTVKDKLFIGGEWVLPDTSDTIAVVSPTTEQVFATVPDGSRRDIDRAVSAARNAFDGGPWPRMAARERADIMDALASCLFARSEEIARTITEENGSPISFSLRGQVQGPLMLLGYYANLARDLRFEEERQGLLGTRAIVRREAVGVVGAIVPWNAPLLVTLSKLAPALATGCTTVIKPPPEAPLDAYILAECLVDAGVPKGVVNIVAAGREIGEYLVTHPGVDAIAFTGSLQAGRRIGSLCGEMIRGVTLELGGKSAAIVCDDADLSSTLAGLVGASTMLNGEGCVLQSRILVSQRRHDELVVGLVDIYRSLKIGDPMESDTAIGPLISERQRERVLAYIDVGEKEGAKVVTGGGRPSHLSQGWFVEPTVFVDVDNKMTIAQEEVFGPVVAVIPYRDMDDAIAIANDSIYGLSGSVWSADEESALEVARRVRTGTLSVNGFMFEFNCPFGGFKESGLGREMGVEGLDPYLEYKSISMPATAVAAFGTIEDVPVDESNE